MFVDLVGSTQLAGALDPEALRMLLRRLRDAIEGAVGAHGGMLAQFFGDGSLVFFGYPTAREDAAEQAVHAGLAVVHAVRGLDAGTPLHVRVGIATGLVVVGELAQRPFSRGDVAVGGPMYLAARLQSVAPVDAVVIGQQTHELAGHLFECEPLGLQALKGFAEDQPAWRVTQARQPGCRFAARRASRGPAPMVGRDAELAELTACWQDVCMHRHARVVAIVADAGLGKSRLVEALLEHVAAQSPVSLQYHCAPRFMNTALYPVITQIERAAGLQREDPPAARLAKLAALLSGSCSAQALPLSVAYIASLLSIPCGDDQPTLPEAAERRKEGLLATLEQHLLALTQGDPVLLLIEDWHWADPSTRELVARILHTIAGRPVLVVVTSRVDVPASWPSAGLAVMRLARLAESESRRVVERVAAGRLAPAAIDEVLRKAEGVPLFIEEITKGAVAVAGESPPGARAPGSAVPGTLRDLMLARLDSLARAKEVAQVGAAIGREFGYGLLRALLPSDEAELRDALETLVEADVVERDGAYPDAQFQFRHALIQDAAYDTLLLGRRPPLHLAIARPPNAGDAHHPEKRPELLAHHLYEGGDLLRASECFHAAGVRAASRAANVEAAAHFRAALRALEALPGTPQRHHRELATQVELGLCVTAAEGYAAPAVSAVYGRARELCAQLHNDVALFPVLRGMCTYYMMRDEFAVALDVARQCARIGALTQRADHRIEADAAIGYILVYQGDVREGRRMLDQALATFEDAPAEHAQAYTVRHAVLAAHALLAIVSWMQGEHEHAQACSRASLALAETTGRPFDLAYATCFAAMLANLRGDHRSAAAHAARASAIAQEHAFKDWLAAATAQFAIAGIALGRAAESVATLESVHAAWQASGAALNLHVIRAALAGAQLMARQPQAALASVDAAIEHAERHGEHWLDAELYRLRGQILEFLPERSQDAATQYRRAIAKAGAQGATFLAMRGALSLFMCDSKAARDSDARDLLRTSFASLAGEALRVPEGMMARVVLQA
jgi:predicted ATPase/class 3 adenylate cyclase